jgi:hypothetical protein
MQHRRKYQAKILMKVRVLKLKSIDTKMSGSLGINTEFLLAFCKCFGRIVEPWFEVKSLLHSHYRNIVYWRCNHFYTIKYCCIDTKMSGSLSFRVSLVIYDSNSDVMYCYCMFAERQAQVFLATPNLLLGKNLNVKVLFIIIKVWNV